MASTPLRQQLSIMRQSFFDEGLLDQGQVSYLETLENEDDPDFIENLFTLFLRDSSRYIASIEKALETTPVDYLVMERMMYRLKGSSASLGASKINAENNKLRKLFHEGDMESSSPETKGGTCQFQAKTFCLCRGNSLTLIISISIYELHTIFLIYICSYSFSSLFQMLKQAKLSEY
ncbi:hypothetical protein NC651_004549 [Populus alba x Populus x berolinensis]|nr:hypothetical protein NC651_004549 [Populus alba x Populus x berolinensis]